MNSSLLFAKVVRRFRKVGPWRTLRQGIGLLSGSSHGDDGFDRKYGTDTSGHLKLWNFDLTSPNAGFGCGYQTIDEQATRDAIRFLNADTHEFTFVDLGCGKGKPLLIAAAMGFKEVVGVEFVHDLVEVARKNLAIGQAANARVLEMDATEYHFPKRDMVVYLFNPFSEEVMSKVIANLEAARENKLYVIYASPICAALFDHCGFLTRLGSPAGSRIQIWASAKLGQVG